MDWKLGGFFLIISIDISCPVVFAEETTKTSRIVQQLAERGFKKCGAELDKVVKWVHEDDDAYAHLSSWSVDLPDKRTAFIVTSQQMGEDNMLTTFTATPDISGKCSITSAQMFVVAKPCTSVRETIFKEWKFHGEIGSTTAYDREDNATLTVLLTPAPNGGCTLSKQALFYY